MIKFIDKSISLDNDKSVHIITPILSYLTIEKYNEQQQKNTSINDTTIIEFTSSENYISYYAPFILYYDDLNDTNNYYNDLKEIFEQQYTKNYIVNKENELKTNENLDSITNIDIIKNNYKKFTLRTLYNFCLDDNIKNKIPYTTYTKYALREMFRYAYFLVYKGYLDSYNSLIPQLKKVEAFDSNISQQIELIAKFIETIGYFNDSLTDEFNVNTINDTLKSNDFESLFPSFISNIYSKLLTTNIIQRMNLEYYATQMTFIDSSNVPLLNISPLSKNIKIRNMSATMAISFRFNCNNGIFTYNLENNKEYISIVGIPNATTNINVTIQLANNSGLRFVGLNGYYETTTTETINARVDADKITFSLPYNEATGRASILLSF